ADSASLHDLLAKHGRANEYARREAVASAWHLAGSAIAFAAGGALAQIDLVLPYYVTAGVAAIAAVIAMVMHDDTPAPAHTTTLRDWTRDMTAAIGEVTRNGRLAWLVGYSAVVFALLPP